jgi:hypothetical protein
VIDISGLDPAAVIAALHNHTRPLGLGFLQAIPRDLTVAEARAMIDEGKRADGTISCGYILGRPVKVIIRGNELHHEDLYDQDAPTTAAKVIADLRAATVP